MSGTNTDHGTLGKEMPDKEPEKGRGSLKVNLQAYLLKQYRGQARDMHGYKKRKKSRNTGPVLSLFALLAKSSVYKILAAAAVMALAEGTLFFRKMRSAVPGSFEGVIGGSLISVIFLAALGAVFFILARTEGLMDERSGDTLLRLRLSGTGIFVIRAFWNLLCLALLFAVQIWLVIGMAESYARTSNTGGSSWQLFLAFYRVEFLHCLLPLADTGKWARNMLLLLAFSTEAAGGIKKKNFVFSVLLLAVTAAWFVSPIGTGFTDVVCGVLHAAVIAANVRKMQKSPEAGR